MRRLLKLAIGIILVSGPAAMANGGSVEGRWLTDDGKAIVVIARCGGSLCGRIGRVLDSGPGVPDKDIMNSDTNLRRRPILGLPVLYGFSVREGKWAGGTAYDPKSGSSYRASLDTNADGSLRVTGCILFFCRSKRWTHQP